MWGVIEDFNSDNLLQCTGLKDKNGKLIYEGDIVRFYDDTICIIKWDNESGMFCTLDTEGQAMIGVPKYYEVLGNIYENPELINTPSLRGTNEVSDAAIQ